MAKSHWLVAYDFGLGQVKQYRISIVKRKGSCYFWTIDCKIKLQKISSHILQFLVLYQLKIMVNVMPINLCSFSDLFERCDIIILRRLLLAELNLAKVALFLTIFLSFSPQQHKMLLCTSNCQLSHSQQKPYTNLRYLDNNRRLSYSTYSSPANGDDFVIFNSCQ